MAIPECRIEPVIVVTALWLVFGGAHIALASASIRRTLVAYLGEGGFTQLFTLVAAASFTALVVYYVAHRFEGVRGLALVDVPIFGWMLRAVLGNLCTSRSNEVKDIPIDG
jgi:1,4-dihydroxy-2-naphthoate octaprenyltransferase